MVRILEFVKQTNLEISTLTIMQSFPLGPGLGDVQAFQGGHQHLNGIDGLVHIGFHDILTPGQFEGQTYIGPMGRVDQMTGSPAVLTRIPNPSFMWSVSTSQAKLRELVQVNALRILNFLLGIFAGLRHIAALI